MQYIMILNSRYIIQQNILDNLWYNLYRIIYVSIYIYTTFVIIFKFEDTCKAHTYLINDTRMIVSSYGLDTIIYFLDPMVSVWGRDTSRNEFHQHVVEGILKFCMTNAYAESFGSIKPT